MFHSTCMCKIELPNTFSKPDMSFGLCGVLLAALYDLQKSVTYGSVHDVHVRLHSVGICLSINGKAITN